MTESSIMAMPDVARVAKRVEALRRANTERDNRLAQVYDLRASKIENIAPGTMPSAWPKPIVANSIDVTARQLAENLAPLPSINCASGVLTSDAAKSRVAKKTKIAYSYVINSSLKSKMPQACDWYITYGALPLVIDPDFKQGRPVMRFDNPLRKYWTRDINGNVTSYAAVYREPAWQLAEKFPEHRDRIMGRDSMGRTCSPDSELELVKYQDDQWHLLYMPERQNLLLQSYANHLGKVAVAIAEKPSYDDQQRGQFDDMVYPQLARARIAMLGLQATQQTVRAPLAIPTDVQKIPFGDDAIIRTNSPEKIRRVGQDVPAVAFQQQQMLDAEMQRGTRTPAAATGDVQASIITGKGVDALNGGYDVQIATGQLMIGRALEQALELCFEMDERYWPDTKKTVSGVINGTPFQQAYVPAKDIKGDYLVSVSYGFASGMNPNQALVFLLQLRGDQLVPRDFVQRQLPMDVDVTQLQAQVDTEQVADALKQGVFAMLSSVGLMAQQGVDPTDILTKAANIIELRERMPIHEAILKAFAPPKQPAPAQGGMDMGSVPGQGGMGDAGMPPMGMNAATGLPRGVAPGQAEMGQGGRPDLQTLLAGLTAGGKPTLAASVRRSVPA